MPYHAALADRVRDLPPTDVSVQEQNMFGGKAFLVDGRMCAGVVDGPVVLWLGRDAATTAIAEDPAAAPMDFTGRVMHNLIYLDPTAVPSDLDLADWLRRAVIAVAARRR